MVEYACHQGVASLRNGGDYVNILGFVPWCNQPSGLARLLACDVVRSRTDVACHLSLPSDSLDPNMDAFLVSTLVVAVGEIGDKTQLLALLLAARFRRPVPIIFGILFATVLNHGLAGLLGEFIRTAISPELLRWLLGLSFIGIALWALKPDTLDSEPASKSANGVFALTFVTFFFAEIGDKTQLATIALAAKYPDLIQVVAGTTLGMLIADVPAVILGEKAAPKLPLKLIRIAAAFIFTALGVAILMALSIG